MTLNVVTTADAISAVSERLVNTSPMRFLFKQQFNQSFVFHRGCVIAEHVEDEKIPESWGKEALGLRRRFLYVYVFDSSLGKAEAYRPS